jgi:hypothetical protein
VERARPRKIPATPSRPRELLAPRRPHDEECRADLEEHGEDVRHRDARLHQVDAVRQQEGRGEQRRSLARQHLPREQEDSGASAMPASDRARRQAQDS